MGADVNHKAFYYINRARKNGASKTTKTTSFDAIAAELDASLKALGNQLRDSRERQVAMFKAANVLRKSIQGGVTDATKPVSRYINGKKVATYHPGNLRRSIKILSHMKDRVNKYVGVERQPGGGVKGIFVGSRTDGYYAHMVEKKRPYFQPGTLAARDEAVKIVLDFVKKQMSGRS